MGITSCDLYRRGNSTGPRMDNVRPRDVKTFLKNGVVWVEGRSGGVSTFASPSPPGTGKIWRLQARSSYSDVLHLENNHSDHWSWEPAYDMEMDRYYRAFLAVVGRKFS
jgi:hypothetical protein